METSEPHGPSGGAQGSENANTEVSLQTIRSTITALLAHCEVPYIVKPYDQFLHDRCLAVCEERGYPFGSNSGRGSDSQHVIDNEFSMLPFLPAGVCIASTTYGHLNSDLPRLIYIAVYTAFLTYLDDFAKRDVESMALFGRKLIRGEKQGHPVFDSLADMLNDTATHFAPTAANMIIHDTLGYVTSLLLDYETEGLDWCPDALGYPYYIRHMSAVPTAYAMFAFSSDMPLKSYIQSIPEIRDYICDMNDVLSFFKEEGRGEEENYVSLVSKSQGLAKSKVLQKLANDVAKTTDQIDKILKGDSAAFHEWSAFKAGYVYFHTSSPRYKMDGLNLG